MAFNSSRWRLQQENAAFAAGIPEGARVLDAGAGEAPYQALFAHTRYETADIQKIERPYADTTYVCDLEDIPVEDARFDYVILNQVLEHVPDPRKVLSELHRVLKPGGRMIYTAPLFYEEHETPYDFYRYTQFGVRHLMETTGFVIERLDWLEGYFGTVGYQLGRMARLLPTRPWELARGITGFALWPLVLALRGVFLAASPLFHWMEKRSKFKRKGYPKNYIAIVSKPGGGSES